MQCGSELHIHEVLWCINPLLFNANLTHCLDSFPKSRSVVVAGSTRLRKSEIFHVKNHPFAPPFCRQRSLRKGHGLNGEKFQRIPFLKPWKWQESALFLSPSFAFVHFLLRSYSVLKLKFELWCHAFNKRDLSTFLFGTHAWFCCHSHISNCNFAPTLKWIFPFFKLQYLSMFR